ncbi:hypothetical protein IZ6_29000 [Terrihabitans soli]|uniref:Uncharacterized protein n=1 Tax=Terrihabitans soli TaxID=708113 RepID=A0A6S6QX83_9HYPH|nr:hypothetical protein [Terrihabitans soli]BCJ92165.1 hypothetical protein IZ6_29000 [Terrihabitans soli]
MTTSLNLSNVVSALILVTGVSASPAASQFKLTPEQARLEGEKVAYQEAEKTPQGFLSHAFSDYVTINECYRARQDYQLVYITETDLEDARRMVKAIEQGVTSKHEPVNTEQAWKDAVTDRPRGISNPAWPGLVFSVEGSEPGAQRWCRSILESLAKRLDKLSLSATPSLTKDF